MTLQPLPPNRNRRESDVVPLTSESLPAKPASVPADVSSTQSLSAGDTSLSPSSTPAQQPGDVGVPQMFGRYRLLKQIGKGGMGFVHLALDTQLNRQVALKIPRRAVLDNPETLERFYREGKSASQIQHPGICRVYDVGAIDGVCFLAMEYLEGITLDRHLKKHLAKQRLPVPRQVALLIRKIALAMQAAHNERIVHRDLKPSNIMLDVHGEPKVMDFGLAVQINDENEERLTETGAVLGTPHYMAPEQVRGDKDLIGSRCDIYSLGVILYEFLTGSLPFTGPWTLVLAQIHTQQPKRPAELRPDVDPTLEALCLHMMAKDPAERFASMQLVVDILTAYLKHGATLGLPATALAAPPAPPTTPAPPPLPSAALGNPASTSVPAFNAAQPQQTMRRSYLIAGGIALGLLVLGVGGLVRTGGGAKSELTQTPPKTPSEPKPPRQDPKPSSKIPSPPDTKLAGQTPPGEDNRQPADPPNLWREPHDRVAEPLKAIPAGSYWEGTFTVSHPQLGEVQYFAAATITQSDEERFSIDVDVEVGEESTAQWQIRGDVQAGTRRISRVELTQTDTKFDESIGNRRGTTGAKAISTGDVSLTEHGLQLYWEFAGRVSDRREIVVNLEQAEFVPASKPNDTPAPNTTPSAPPKIVQEIRLPASEKDTIEAADKKYRDRCEALKMKLVKDTENTIRKYSKNDSQKGMMQTELNALTADNQIPLSLLLRKESFIYMDSLLEEHEKLKKIYRGAAERLKQAGDTRGFESLKAHSETLPFVVARWDCEFAMKIPPVVPNVNPLAQNNTVNQSNAVSQITPSDKQFVTLDFYSDSGARNREPVEGFQAFSWAWPKTSSPILKLIHNSSVVQLSSNVDVSIQGNDNNAKWEDFWTLSDDGQRIQGSSIRFNQNNSSWCYDFIARRVMP